MNIKDIVFNKEYKFGVVVDIDNQISEVHFYNYDENKKIVNNYLTKVNSAIIDYFVNDNFRNFFYNATLAKGKAYQLEHRVEEIEYSDKEISAVVFGNYPYNTTIKINNNRLSFSCDCPVSKNCKHAAALCYELDDIFTSLKNDAAKIIVEKKALSQEILLAYSHIHYRQEQYDNATIIINDLLKNDDNYLVNFLNYVSKEYNNNNRYYLNYRYKREEMLVYYFLAYNDTLRERILAIENKSQINDYDELSKYLKKGLNVSNHYKYNEFSSSNVNRVKHLPLYYIVNGKYFDYLKLAFSVYEYFEIDQSAIEFCSRHIEYSDSLFYLIANSRFDDLNYFKSLIKLFPIDKKIELFKLENKDYDFTYEEIKDIDHENKLILLSKADVDQKDVEYILTNDIDIVNDDNKQIAGLILNLYERTTVKKHLKLMIDIIKKLKGSNYLLEYLLERESSYSNHNAYYSWRAYENRLEHSDFDFSNVDLDNFTRYFDISFNVGRKGDNLDIDYYMRDAAGEIVMEINDYNEEVIVRTNYFDAIYDGYYAYFLIWYCNNIKREELNKAKNKILEKIQEEKEEEICSHALYDMQKISKKYISSSIVLADNKKAKIEYNLNLRDLSMSFKVGIDKLYVVKDAIDFFRAFLKSEIVSYGKNLTLVHTLDNIDEKDRKIVDYLSKASLSYGCDRKTIMINELMLAQILTMLKGRYIVCGADEYFVSLDNIEPEINVDENYRIHCGFKEIENYLFIRTNDTAFIFDKDNKKIDIYKDTSSSIDFFEFASKYNNLRIKRIANEFKSNLLIHFNDQVKIDEKIKEDLKVSVVVIKAYFDYEDKKINVKEEYYKDDVKVNSKELDENDKFKVNFFHQYLETLGFIDNVIEDENKALAFFYMDFEEFKKYAEIYLSESITNKKISVFSPATIRVSYDGVIMKAMIEDSKYSNEELEAIMKALKQKKKYVLLKDNKIIDISNKNSEDFYETVDDLNLNIKKLNEENKLSLIQSIKALAHQNNCTVDGYLTNMMAEISGFKNNDISLPPINGELRPYQIDGLKWLTVLSKYNVGGILADDMGLGKTLEVISLILNSDKEKPSIIICPKTLVFNWKNEFMRFANNIDVIEIYGNKDERDFKIRSIEDNKKVVYICSYDSLRIDIEEYNTIFDYAIIDEAQYIKNVNAQKSISIKKLKADHKFALTGTPIENNLIDLWSIFDFVMPGYLDDLTTFKTKFNDDNFIQLVSKRVAPFILRRIKQDVLKDLPEKYETILSVDMMDSQRKLYDAFKNEVNQKLESGSKAFDILPYLTRLRQICVNPKMFVDDYKGDIAKMELLSNLLDDYLSKGHKLLIFSQFVKALNEIEDLLHKKKINYSLITGKTDGKDRIEIADSFNNNSNEKVLLISLKAGGTGLNLIGADTVVHLDPWWNVAAENQASDRAHRIGQKQNVEIIKIICSNSIEQRVIELQNIKKDLIDKVIADNDESIITSSLENIKYLLDD